MCDTLGQIVSNNLALFAKNSDRSPNEPQITEYRHAAKHREKTLRATYIEIEQVEHTHATLLSRPIWMWGAEIGVNEFGVCIGNEAVFTKGKYTKSGLLGMDLVRLGLERGKSAKDAAEVIINLLEQYGQGGNCGYDHDFYYDNSFLIMDRQEIYILETAHKNWVYKRVNNASISNRLSIGDDGDAYSTGKAYDFKKKHLEPVYSHFSGSKHRAALTKECLTPKMGAADMFSALRSHRSGAIGHMTSGDVASPCMHAGGLVGDHTTASMVVELRDTITVWLTGSSTPCISLFKPWVFGNPTVPPVFSSGNTAEATRYWKEREAFARKSVGQELTAKFYSEKASLESEWLSAADGMPKEQMANLSRQAAEQESDFYYEWMQADLMRPQGKKKYLHYWQKKTAALETPARATVNG